MKKIEIVYHDSHHVQIRCELAGQELYETYVALTVQIATQLNSVSDIRIMAATAADDALRMIASHQSQLGS